MVDYIVVIQHSVAAVVGDRRLVEAVSEGKHALDRLILVDDQQESVHEVSEGVEGPKRAVFDVVQEHVVEHLVEEPLHHLLS